MTPVPVLVRTCPLNPPPFKLPVTFKFPFNCKGALQVTVCPETFKFPFICKVELQVTVCPVRPRMTPDVVALVVPICT